MLFAVEMTEVLPDRYVDQYGLIDFTAVCSPFAEHQTKKQTHDYDCHKSMLELVHFSRK